MSMPRRILEMGVVLSVPISELESSESTQLDETVTGTWIHHWRSDDSTKPNISNAQGNYFAR